MYRKWAHSLCIIYRLVFDVFSESKLMRILFSENRWLVEILTQDLHLLKASFNKYDPINPLNCNMINTYSQKLDFPQQNSCKSFTLNDIWIEHKNLFEEWLRTKISRKGQNTLYCRIRRRTFHTIKREISCSL